MKEAYNSASYLYCCETSRVKTLSKFLFIYSEISQEVSTLAFGGIRRKKGCHDLYFLVTDIITDVTRSLQKNG
jgi:hypothetical protein